MDQGNARGDFPPGGLDLIPQLCVVKLTTDTIPTGTPTIIDFSEAIFDVSPIDSGLALMWSAGDPSKIILNEDGFWTYFGFGLTQTPNRFEFRVRILINGIGGFQGWRNMTYAGPNYGQNPYGQRVSALNDYLQLEVTHQNGSDVTMGPFYLGAYRNQEDK